MSTPILVTKLYIPPPRPKVVLRRRLIERLNQGLRQNQGFGRKLTLILASAYFGKTTLISEWAAGCEHPVAGLSLDEGIVTRLLSGLPLSCFADAGAEGSRRDRSRYWRSSDGCAPIPPATANRQDPQLPPAGYRAQGQLTELRASASSFGALGFDGIRWPWWHLRSPISRRKVPARSIFGSSSRLMVYVVPFLLFDALTSTAYVVVPIAPALTGTIAARSAMIAIDWAVALAVILAAGSLRLARSWPLQTQA
jgi:hypothetical protein